MGTGVCCGNRVLMDPKSLDDNGRIVFASELVDGSVKAVIENVCMQRSWTVNTERKAMELMFRSIVLLVIFVNSVCDYDCTKS